LDVFPSADGAVALPRLKDLLSRSILTPTGTCAEERFEQSNDLVQIERLPYQASGSERE
jgi:hypothetical protein